MRPDSTDNFAAPRPRSHRAFGALRLGAIWLLISAVFAAGQAISVEAPVALTPLVVTASRAPQALDRVAFSARILTGAELLAAPTATLDGALRAVPGFSLFRRSDSFSANPTAQGVSLRGLGPSGASRSLVLLDGVPLNDPFGGWVLWSQLPRESIAGAEIVRGGGATAWGNAALGGVIQLLSPTLNADHTTLSASAGAFSTRRASLGVTRTLGASSVQLFGETFTTAGFNLVAPERRGSIDEPAASNHSAFNVRARTRLGENLEAIVTARTFEETRHNGTPYQRNGARSHFAAVGLSGAVTPAFTWNASAYAQRGRFASTFSSINATRTAETPASDQFAVPSRANGAAWSSTWSHARDAKTSFGLDARTVRGETQENFTFTNGAYTRQRFAGGQQSFAGLFALHEQPLARDFTLTLGARLDDWSESDGHRRESINATSALARDDHYADQHGIEFSPSAGLVWRTTSELRLRAAAQQAFRRPTLNELYRPFRAGSTVTEANPMLRTERVTSAEVGSDWTRGAFGLTGAIFWNELRDAVGNVTVARGPGTFPIVGTLAAGGLGRQRLNLDTTRVRGIEFSTNYRLNDRLRFTAEALWNDATVRRADVAPALEGKRVAQVPRHTLTFGGTWRAPGGITLTPRLRWIGAQSEDDENTLRLGEVAVIDLGAFYPLGRGWELFVSAENLGNARIETGRSADGVVNTGTPRLGLAGVRGSW
jgi:outer membrane cobalamin receptor